MTVLQTPIGIAIVEGRIIPTLLQTEGSLPRRPRAKAVLFCSFFLHSCLCVRYACWLKYVGLTTLKVRCDDMRQTGCRSPAVDVISLSTQEQRRCTVCYPLISGQINAEVNQRSPHLPNNSDCS